MVGRAFTNTQGKLLQLMLNGVEHGEAADQIGVSKQAVSQALSGLREHGLLVSTPSLPCRTKMVDPRKDGFVVRWKDQHGAEWSVTTVPIGRYERPDLRPERAVVLLKQPDGEVPMVFSYRLRLSFQDVDRQMRSAIAEGHVDCNVHGPGGADVTVRVVTEMVAKSMGLESVLPAWFLKEDDDGGDGDEGQDRRAG